MTNRKQTRDSQRPGEPSGLAFISDLHLAPDQPEPIARFQALLRHLAGRVEALYILGDLFDAWLGDDDPSPFAHKIRAQLEAFSARTPLFIQRGNRDFLLGEEFARQTGATLLPDEHLLTRQPGRLLLMHGDQLCTDDLEYQAWRRQIRAPGAREQLLALPLEERRRRAERYRRMSQEAVARKDDEIMDVNPQAVAHAMATHGADLLIHGHTHRPAFHRLAAGRHRLVLPDWRPRESRLGLLLDEEGWRWLE